MNTEKAQAPVLLEADRGELFEILTEQTPGFVTNEHVEAVIRALPKAIATLLLRSEPLEDGTRRCELFGGNIIAMKRKPASVGVGLADGVPIPEHFQVHTKLQDHFLDVLEATFGLACKNG